MDTKYERVIQYVLETPWAIRPAVLEAILDVLAYRAEGGQFTDEELVERVGAAEAARRSPQRAGSVAIVPIWGSIFPRANLFTEFSGGTSLQKFSAALAEVDNDSQVGSIVLDVSSPGGLVGLVPETAEQIRKTSKPVTAVVNTEAASAAYWLAAQADELVVTPSGWVGSIGVFSAHEDISRLQDNVGVKTTLVSAGKFKVEGSPFEPLGEEARAAMQKTVDTYYDMFTRDVARGRKTSVDAVRSGFGEGRMVTAEAAVAEGMADRVATINQVVSEMLEGRGPSGHRLEKFTTVGSAAPEHFGFAQPDSAASDSDPERVDEESDFLKALLDAERVDEEADFYKALLNQI